MKKTKRAPKQGTHVVWPAGVEERYGINPVTRWRWERTGNLPPRDVFCGRRSGWKPETLAAHSAASQHKAA